MSTPALAGRRYAVALVAVLAASGARALTPSGTTGQSWKDPPLGEILATADLVAEVKVLAGGQFGALVDVVRTFKGTARGTLRIQGFNSYEWNTAYYAMREDEDYLLALYAPAPGVWCLPTPGAGRYPVDRGHVIGRFGAGEFVVEVPLDDFRSALASFYQSDPAAASAALGRLLATGALETRYLAVVLSGELAATRPASAPGTIATLEPLVRDENVSVREAAARALGRAGGAAAARALAPFVADADESVARAAALAVCATGAGGAGRAVVAWLERSAIDNDTARTRADRETLSAQAAVFQFLAESEWPRDADEEERAAVVRGLVEIVASGRAARARVASRALGLIGAADAVDALVRLLDAEDEALRDEAASALMRITLSPTAYARERFVEWWRVHGGKGRRAWVAQGLAVAARALEEDSYDGDQLARALVAMARDPLGAWAVRARLAGGAGWSAAPIEEIGGPLVAALAERGLASPSISTRLASARTLAALVGRFGRLGTMLAPALADAACDSDADVRKAALAVLEKVDAATLEAPARGALAAQLTLQMARESDAATRHAAARALEQLAGKYFGFYVSKGYELAEEMHGLEAWERWAAGAWSPAGRARAPARRSRDGRPVSLRIADEDAAVWVPAAEDLVGGDEGARAALEALATNPEPRVRAIAAALLGMRGERASAHALEPLLGDAEAMVRLQAAWALGNCLSGTGRAPAGLVAFAEEAAAAAVSPPPPAPATTGPADETLPPSVVDPAPLRPRATRPLAAIPAQALHALGRIGGPEARALLSRCAVADDPLGSAAAFAMAVSPGDGAAAALPEVLVATASSQARELLARALVARRPPGAAPALAQTAARIDRWFAYPLINALAKIARAEDAPALAPFLDPANESAGVAAAYALWQAPGPAAAEGLVGILENGADTPRYYAAKAIGALAKDGGLPEALRPRASAALAAHLAQYDMALASACASALEYAGEPTAFPALDKYVGGYVPADFRAFGALVRLGGQAGFALVREQLKTESWGAKYYGLRAVRYLPTAEGIGLLLTHWRDPESQYQEVAARTLLLCGPRAVDVLARVLREGSPGERRRAAVVLAGFALPEATGALERAAASVDPALARVARMMLEDRRVPSPDAPAAEGRPR